MPSELFVLGPMRDRYYLESIVFKVENTLFKVPRFQFERHSEIFATTFSLPPPIEGAEGSSDETPFKLGGIECDDFKMLLKVLYPMTPVPKTPCLLHEEWISVLKLANLWSFIEVRNLAVEQLTFHSERLDCIERILFARQYDVSSWLRSGYAELARRKAAISSEEAVKIGWEAALQICQLREAAVSTKSGKNPYEKADIGNVFQAEFARADSAHEPMSTSARFQLDFKATRAVTSASNGKAHTFVTTATTPFGPVPSQGISGASADTAPKPGAAIRPVGRPFAIAADSNFKASGFGNFSALGPSAFGSGFSNTSAAPTTGGAFRSFTTASAFDVTNGSGFVSAMAPWVSASVVTGGALSSSAAPASAFGPAPAPHSFSSIFGKHPTASTPAATGGASDPSAAPAKALGSLSDAELRFLFPRPPPVHTKSAEIGGASAGPAASAIRLMPPGASSTETLGIPPHLWRLAALPAALLRPPAVLKALSWQIPPPVSLQDPHRPEDRIP
ncbi:hypothetical protein K438DRAFT_436048 [Mycena galopus ATCC 62051]|nr:hypothetical protein K438DRAFT_436048 [Mycena galopus ATCC 62051]